MHLQTLMITCVKDLSMVVVYCGSELSVDQLPKVSSECLESVIEQMLLHFHRAALFSQAYHLYECVCWGGGGGGGG